MHSENRHVQSDPSRRDILKTIAISSSALLLNLPLVGCGGGSTDELPVSLKSRVLASGSFGQLHRSWRMHYQLLLTYPDGTVITFGGSRPSPKDVNCPIAAAVGSDGSFWVADTGNHRLLHLSSSLQVLETITSLAGVRLRFPSGLAILEDGRMAVADYGVGRVAMTDTTGAWAWMGTPVESQIAAGWRPNWKSETNHSLLDNPKIIAANPDNSLAVLDTAARRIVIFSPTGTAINSIYLGGRPSGLAISPDGRYYVADVHAKTVTAFYASNPAALKVISIPFGSSPYRLIWNIGADENITNLIISSLS